MGAQSLDELGTSQHNAALRPPQQFVSAPQNEIGSGGQALLKGGFLRETESDGLDETSAADVIEAREAVAVSQRAQFVDFGRLSKALNAVIRRMHAQQGGGG